MITSNSRSPYLTKTSPLQFINVVEQLTIDSVTKKKMLHTINFYLLVVLLLLISITQAQVSQPPSSSKDYVILLHGLGRTSWSMRPLEKHLKKRGFRTINIGYPSRKLPIEELAKYIEAEIKQKCTDKEADIHFVTHSMGGIIIRYYLENNQLEHLGRVVMLSPPNKGSEIADTLRKYSFFSMITGPAGLQLGTDPESIPNTLASVDFELGIITGNTSLLLPFSRIIPGEDDGMVSVESAKVDGMNDFLVVPHGHTFIMRSQEVANQVTSFLQNGKFHKE